MHLTVSSKCVKGSRPFCILSPVTSFRCQSQIVLLRSWLLCRSCIIPSLEKRRAWSTMLLWKPCRILVSAKHSRKQQSSAFKIPSQESIPRTLQTLGGRIGFWFLFFTGLTSSWQSTICTRAFWPSLKDTPRDFKLRSLCSTLHIQFFFVVKVTHTHTHTHPHTHTHTHTHTHIHTHQGSTDWSPVRWWVLLLWSEMQL